MIEGNHIFLYKAGQIKRIRDKCGIIDKPRNPTVIEWGSRHSIQADCFGGIMLDLRSLAKEIIRKE